MSQLLVVIYGYLLRLYPVRFRTDFADEMYMIFAQTVNDAVRRQSDLALLQVVGRELRDLPVNLLREHQRERRRRSAPVRVSRYSGLDGLRRIRRLTRVAAVIMGTLMLMPVVAGLSHYQLMLQTVPFIPALSIVSSGLLIACRWERLGAMLTLIGGLLVGAGTVYTAYMAATLAGMNPVGVMLASSLWVLPFVIFALLFLQYNRREMYLRTLLN